MMAAIAKSTQPTPMASFKSLLNLPDDTMAKRFANLADHHGLTASSMSDEWEAFQLSHDDDAVPNDANFTTFRSFLNKAMMNKTKSSSSKPKPNMNLTGQKRSAPTANPLSSPPAAVKVKKESVQRVSASPVPSYEDRKNVGQVVAHFNTHLPAPEKVSPGERGTIPLLGGEHGRFKTRKSCDRRKRNPLFLKPP